LTAPCKSITHRTIVSSSQSDRVKSAESRIAEDPWWAGAGAETGGLETAVQEGVGCKGGRGAGLRTQAEMGILNSRKCSEVWWVGVIMSGWKA
jgi:hypothetical protein